MHLIKKLPKMQNSDSYTLKQIAEYLGASVEGDETHQITSLATLEAANSQQLSFLANPKYKKYLHVTQAGGVLLRKEHAVDFVGNAIVSQDPYLDYAKITAFFVAAVQRSGQYIHPSAVIADDVTLPQNIAIGPNAVIESGCTIGEFSDIGAGTCLGSNVTVGEHCLIHANVSIYASSVIGSHCIIHSGAVIGADGFGFAPSEQGWQKIYQLGRVILGNAVEIGASATIDRGALADTIIHNGVKIDNQVQIAHNVQIGENTAIAASTAIAGSTIIGKNCTIAGCAGIVGHIEITDNVHISGMTMVSKSIKCSGSYSSGVPMSETAKWRKNAARFHQLDQLARQIKKNSKSGTSD